MGVWFQRGDYVFPKAKDTRISVLLPLSMNREDKYMAEQSYGMI